MFSNFTIDMKGIELTEEQLQQMNDVFNQPLSDRSGKKPPVFQEGESIQEFVKRFDNYNFQYYNDKKNIK